MSGISETISAAGGQVKLAESLGVRQQAVSQWLQRGWVPLERAREIETLYGIPRVRLINPRIADLVDLPSESEGGDL